MLNFIPTAALRAKTGDGRHGLERVAAPDMLAQDRFLALLRLEQRRTERSRRRFVLMLIDFSDLFAANDGRRELKRFTATLSASIRETDVAGWYKQGVSVGVIFTEIGDCSGKVVLSALSEKVRDALSSTFSGEDLGRIRVSFHIFPEGSEADNAGRSSGGGIFYKEGAPDRRKQWAAGIKRAIDIAGSLAALVLLSPVLAAIALAVKLTSKGPVLFRQERVGAGGATFTFLKFRSMRSGNNTAIHEAFVKELITGANGDRRQQAPPRGVYKITNDPRITPIGRFLRKTSLDELPQLFNVLRAEMSLVGPRPPIPYEVKCYDIWHRRRFFSVKPGITGLWQVSGRSRVGFDDMVRLDLKYARTWSLWLDLKILLQTPKAIVSGEGAW